ncbi:MAG: magnesium chelatase subunit D [Pseudomonadota bacterium]
MNHRALPQENAAAVALLLATNPNALGGVILGGLPGPWRDSWLSGYRSLLTSEQPWKKVPVNIGDDRLLGGLDFAATIAAGRPMYATGVLEAANGGVLVLAMAERMRPLTASVISETMDSGRLQVERDGARRECDTHFSVVALDEGLEPDEKTPDGLAERLAFHVRLDHSPDMSELAQWTRSDLQRARRRINSIRIRQSLLEQFSQAAFAFGVSTLRAELFMLSVARTAAALSGRRAVTDEHAELAVRLVLPQRAQRLPQSPQDDVEAAPREDEEQEREQTPGKRDMPDDVLVDAVLASLPDKLLEQLALSATSSQRASGGRAGPATKSRLRGRPVGVVVEERPQGARLNVLATLKAAAPWQSVRRGDSNTRRLRLRPEDLHINRYEDRVETTTIFVVDASGSQAAQRLAEVKGAIELLLNDCYVRRDQVALIAFRKEGADVLLEPTRALARVKRSLSALPGGGGTPLAAGLDAARAMALGLKRLGRVPAVVLMTDGRANIARDGSPGPDQAEVDARASARLFRVEGIESLLVDTSRRPKPRAQALANEMGATYIALPQADANRISTTVQRTLAA